MKKIRTYFIDMDGVLAKYDRHAYDRKNGPAPGIALFEHEPSHYCRTCVPDPRAIALLEALASKSYAKVFIMTSVAEHTPWIDEDKKAWLREHCPFIDADRQLVIARRNKVETALKIISADRLDKNAVLVDDFNQNLRIWQASGGRAVKYLNDVNSPGSWKGLFIDGRDRNK